MPDSNFCKRLIFLFSHLLFWIFRALINCISFITDNAKRPKLEELKKKERKQVRKQVKNNFELAQKAKTAWEVIRK